MRTISSRKFVTEFAPPLNSGLPFEAKALLAGKMPALTKAAEFVLIMQVGMMLPGKGDPCTMPAGATPPQPAKRTAGATCAAVGTVIGVASELKLPPYVAVPGTVWLVAPPVISGRHSIL